jgi:hypothetical protein
MGIEIADRDYMTFAKFMVGAAEIFGIQLTAERIRGYWTILQHIPVTQLTTAWVVACRSNDRFPLPAQLIALVEGDTGDNDLEAEAAAAWAKLEPLLSKPSDARDLVLSDERIAAGVAALGGLYVAHTGSEALQWKRRNFILAYKGTAKRMRLTRAYAGADLDHVPKDSKLRKLLENTTEKLGEGKGNGTA